MTIDCPICSGSAEEDVDFMVKSPDDYRFKSKKDYEDTLAHGVARKSVPQQRMIKVHVCKNCGATIRKDGKLFNSKGSEINMFGDTQDYG